MTFISNKKLETLDLQQNCEDNSGEHRHSCLCSTLAATLLHLLSPLIREQTLARVQGAPPGDAQGANI